MFKLSTASLLAVFAAVATSVVAQSIPQVGSFPAACAQQCSSTIQSSVLCFQQYKTGQDIVSCFCSGIPSESDVSTCSTCLTSNNGAEMAGVLSAIPSACGTYQKTCQKECGFDTCPSSDVGCQCSEAYLANIYQCASCNTRNNNTGATGVTDYEALAGSCGNQNYTVPAISSSALPSPTGQESYTAPTLAASASSYSAGASTVTGFAISTEGSPAAPATSLPVSTPQPLQKSQAPGGGSVAQPPASSNVAPTTAPSGSATAAKSGTSPAATASPVASAPASGALATGVNALGAIGAVFAAIALL
ncbi:hypothetical protein QFC20_004114 [Naganishia adeliensis]|uniref:Uncharacterized protein n=1 Tax=Naganishia adeliensis TaxID=92952 RepID=A0ACC2W3S0_9TREE|nr:hypothetical protein QFC20_004114 [Naganishia adeliensis]